VHSFPSLTLAGRKVKAYLFGGYWEDIGTIKSFFESNLALAQDPPKFEFFDPHRGPIMTSPRHLPPARIDTCEVEDAIISFGAHIKDAKVSNAIIGLRSLVRSLAPLLHMPRVHPKHPWFFLTACCR
jgi:glucose-1-phosphate adenylyltransferase